MKKYIKSSTKYIKIVVVLVLAFEFFSICSSTYNADKMYEKAKDASDKIDLSSAFTYAEKAIKLNPLEPNYYRMRARVLINYLPYKDKSVRVFTKQLVIKDLENAYNLNTDNLVTMRNLVPLYYFVAADSITSPATAANVDPYYIDPAKNFYAKIKNYSKNDVGVYALLAKYEKRLGLMDEYNVSVEKVRDLRPDLLDWFENFQ